MAKTESKSPKKSTVTAEALCDVMSHVGELQSCWGVPFSVVQKDGAAALVAELSQEDYEAMKEAKRVK